ncbi:hypothetical protein DPX16_4313 [Anabarilius grahami]|uniref:Uncharacterized protein n=1 Tax=Anabarilius grahami TaxID=495550 RepID=A0A3N0YDR7_ANAGA|nr:hypothetical protein DPX16_4313 [Anabarilius grahami]
MEVVIRAIAKLNINCPAEKQKVRHSSLLDKCFLPSRSQPTRRGLPFFPNLHTEVSRLWKKPVSYRVFSPQTCKFKYHGTETVWGDASGSRDAYELSLCRVCIVPESPEITH